MRSTDDKRGFSLRSQRQRAALILALSAIVRILVAHHALATFGTPWFFLRGTEMGYLAQSILEGKGLSSPFGTPTGPTAMICPGYPLIVAAAFRAFGSYSTAAATALIALNIALNVLCAWWILLLGRRLASSRSAQWVAILWALSPPLLWMPTIFWDTSLSAAGILGAVVFATRRTSRMKPLQWAAVGAACGLLGLVNPALLPCLLSILGFTALRERYRWRKLFSLLCGSVLLFAPWPIRNARVFHAWVPTRTTLGMELWMGNHEGGDGYLDRSRFPTYNQHELASYKQMGEVAFMQQKEQLGLAYIRSRSLAFGALTLKRVIRFWIGAGSQPGVLAYVLHAYFTSFLGLWGLLRLWRQRSLLALFSFVAAFVLFPLPYYVTHAEFRYRLVIDPLLIVLAALPIEAFLSRRGRRKCYSNTAPALLLKLKQFHG